MGEPGNNGKRGPESHRLHVTELLETSTGYHTIGLNQAPLLTSRRVFDVSDLPTIRTHATRVICQPMAAWERANLNNLGEMQ
jgi:hypothetical protein